MGERVVDGKGKLPAEKPPLLACVMQKQIGSSKSAFGRSPTIRSSYRVVDGFLIVYAHLGVFQLKRGTIGMPFLF